jgi:hypothetical protein
MSSRTDIKNIKVSSKLPLIIAISSALSAPVLADEVSVTNDGFKMRNAFEVRAISKTNAAGSFDEDASGQEYFTQVFNSVGSYTVGHDYSMNWWVKVGDGVWGQDYGENTSGGTVVNEDAELEIDSLYAAVKNQTLDFKIGIVPLFFGNGYNLQTDGYTGSTLEIYPSEKSTLYFVASLVSENDSDDYTGYTNEDGRDYIDGTGDGDEYVLGLQYGRNFEGGDVKVFYGTRFSAASSYTATDEDGTETDTDTAAWDKNTVGISGNYRSGDISYNGEAAHFFGTTDSDTDYTGLQMQLGATYTLGSGSIEGNFYYAQGADSDEEQATGLQKQGFVQPFQKGLGPSFNHNDSDLKLMPKPLNIFMIAQNSGVIGAAVNGLYKPSSELTLAAAVMYMVPENDETDSTLGYADYSEWTGLSVLNVGLDYAFNQYVNVGAAASYKSFSADSGSTLDDAMGVGATINFNF